MSKSYKLFLRSLIVSVCLVVFGQTAFAEQVRVFVNYGNLPTDHYGFGSEEGLYTIDNGGLEVLPSGACGMRFSNVSGWSWLRVSGGQMNELANNGDRVDSIEYYGPHAGCSGGNYIFNTPATPDGEVPEGAGALAVTVSGLENVEFIGSAGHPIEIPGFGPDREIPSLCEIAEEFCETELDFQIQTCHKDIVTGKNSCEDDRAPYQLHIALVNVVGEIDRKRRSLFRKVKPDEKRDNRTLKILLNAEKLTQKKNLSKITLLAVKQCRSYAKAIFSGSKVKPLRRAGRSCQKATRLVKAEILRRQFVTLKKLIKSKKIKTK